MSDDAPGNGTDARRQPRAIRLPGPHVGPHVQDDAAAGAGEEGGRLAGHGPTRRGVLAGGAALLALGSGAGTWWVSRSDDGGAGVPEVVRPENTSDATGPDVTSELQALLDEGESKVVVPVGTHVVSSTLVVPWQVREVQLPAGTVIHMRGDAIAMRRAGRVDPRARAVSQALEGRDELVFEGDFEGDELRPGAWLYLCSDDWVKEGKSLAGMLRRVVRTDLGRVYVDKPLFRSLTRSPRAHLVELAPSFALTGSGAVENGDPTGTFSNLVRLDFVDGIEVVGVELRNCGSAALRTFGTVGGVVDCYIHDCVDDQGAGHYGYGVSVTSTTRDLRVLGTIERVRHAFTTDHGYDPIEPAIARTGEPEDIYVAPVVRDTTSTGIDTHEPGYGITITPDVTGCGTVKWGGLNVRARNVTIEGGRIADSGEWGILISPSARGTVIRDVEVAGVRSGRGIHAKAGVTIDDVSISGFGDSFGLHVESGAPVTMTRTLLDGVGIEQARAIVLEDGASSLEGTVRDCSIGVLRSELAESSRLDLAYERVAREEVVTG